MIFQIVKGDNNDNKKFFYGEMLQNRISYTNGCRLNSFAGSKMRR
jgi:hypothetical protein